MKPQKILAISLCSFALVGLTLSPAAAQRRKAKTIKVSGNVGNVNEQKHTITIVTKDAKIITINIRRKAKFKIAKPGKLGDTPLGATIEAQVDAHGNAASVVIIPRH